MDLCPWCSLTSDIYFICLDGTGILEVVRTGQVAMPRDSGVNSEFLETMSTGRIW